jgi:RNA polymerase sigma-70 factor, ECF subfamily
MGASASSQAEWVVPQSRSPGASEALGGGRAAGMGPKTPNAAPATGDRAHLHPPMAQLGHRALWGRAIARDDVMVKRLQSGDEEAFAELVERYHTRLVGLAKALVGDRAGAEDVVQDTWVAVIRGVARFEGRSSLQTWLFQICANRARSFRSRGPRAFPIGLGEPTVPPGRFGAAGQWASPLEPWPEVDDRLVADAMVPAVRAALESLPELQRQVVTLRDVEGLTSQEVCAVLAVSEANQRVLLHRGRARARETLENKMRELRECPGIRP